MDITSKIADYYSFSSVFFRLFVAFMTYVIRYFHVWKFFK